MKTLVVILILQLSFGASALAKQPDDAAAVESGLQQGNVATAFNVDRQADEARVKALIDELELDKVGGVGGSGSRVRAANVNTPRPTGNEWGERGAANK